MAEGLLEAVRASVVFPPLCSLGSFLPRLLGGMEHPRLFSQHGSFLAAALDFPVGQARPSTAQPPVHRPLAKPRPRRVASARGAPRPSARGPNEAREAAAAMAATLKRPEEPKPPLISRACGGSISARGPDAVRPDSRPGTALRHLVERHLPNP